VPVWTLPSGSTVAAHIMAAEAPAPRGRGRPRLPTPERRERMMASKRAWCERNAAHLCAANRARRATDAYRAQRRAAWHTHHPPRQRLSEEERRERHREAVRRYHARVRERKHVAQEARVQSPSPS
jgi:hypothetical protein